MSKNIIGKEAPKELEKHVVTHLRKSVITLCKRYNVSITYENNHGGVFTKSGKPDATITIGSMFQFYVELKTSKGKASALQIQWIKDQNEKHPGIPACFAYGKKGCDAILILLESFLDKPTQMPTMEAWSDFARDIRTVHTFK